ncbi:pilus assembly protein [Flocculibacter collagenilyticus]|uniref:pilus assembly protein n=1 Tax=Flocculibacter collagenilyticus TaxID=2744479 RepID=UPI0018F3D582|nr:PilC/PilY family type IV pilus protein [Flocculibacter collagenilyticus]
MKKFIFFLASLITVLSVSTQADDIEIYLGDAALRGSSRPQVLVILDTSGSMAVAQHGGIVQVKPFYDPETVYPSLGGADNDSNAIFYIKGALGSEELPNPSSSSEKRRFSGQHLACNTSNTYLTKYGYYTGKVKEYKFNGNTGGWQNISSYDGLSGEGVVECWDDIDRKNQDNSGKKDFNNNGLLNGYPVNGKGDALNPVYFEAGDSGLTAAKAAGLEEGESTTLYTANYLRWHFNTNLGLVNKTKMEIAQRTIEGLFATTPSADFGLQIFNKGSNGGRVIAKIQGRDSDEMDDMIDNKLNKTVGDGGTPLCESLYEAYRYFAGKSLLYGKALSNPSPARDTTAEDKGAYISPYSSCKNELYIVMITDGKPTGDKNANSLIKSVAGLSDSDKSSFSDGKDSTFIPAFAEWLNTEDINPNLSGTQTAKLYTVGFGQAVITAAGDMLEEAARRGGGKYYPVTSPTKLQNALQSAIANISKVNGTFSSPGVAVNTTDPTRTLDYLYYAMFKPDKGSRWRGNLKKLKISGTKIVDQTGTQDAILADGTISPEAKTFWTVGSKADGNTVEEGGVNQALVNQSSRKLFSNDGTSLVDFTFNNLKNIAGNKNQLAQLMNIDKNQIDYYLNWAKGKDVDGSDTSKNRQDILGDPLHAKPLVINYGGSPADIRIILGTNAGFLHMFKDNDTTVEEKWALMPFELIPNISTLKHNYPSDGKVYGVDGTPAVFVDDKNGDGVINGDTDTVWAFVGMRRGGSSYYALDLSKPDSPTIKWIINSNSSDFEELGQTWSKPYVMYHPINVDENGNAKPILVFGAGYSTSSDVLNVKAPDSVGRGIYMVDADSGNLLWKLTPEESANIKFEGEHSIPSSISPFDADFDGYTDRLYFSDTGGNVWRADIGDVDKSKWKVYKFAELGSDASEFPADDRRFFSEPAIARSFFSATREVTINGNTSITRAEQPYDAVVIGSGNRARPLASGVNDYLFVLRDTRTLAQPLADDETFEPIRLNDLLLNKLSGGKLTLEIDDEVQMKEKMLEFSQLKGWYYPLANKEKSLSPSFVLGGKAYFNSYAPADQLEEGECVYKPAGSMYAFDLNMGTRLFTEIKIPQTVQGIPDMPQIVVPECTGADCKKGQVYLAVPADGIEVEGKPDSKCTGDKCDLLEASGVTISTQRAYLYVEENGAR